MSDSIEAFSNFSPSPNPFGTPSPRSSSPNLATQIPTDIQAIYNKTPPACPVANKSATFNQQFTVTVGTVKYSPTTVVSIAESSNSQGLPSFNVSITTP
jgi:hypothetical protein